MAGQASDRAEKTGYERTASSPEVLEFIDALRWSSDKVQVITVYNSLRRTCPAVVLANPRVTTPEEAAKSGKTVVYLQGNIHPYEPEGKEALLMLAREILFGKLQAPARRPDHHRLPEPSTSTATTP